MGSQFVDLNGDGNLDYLTATFDGSPHVAWGSPEGFAEPERLKDAQGRRVVISYIWDYEKETHRSVGYAMPDGQPVEERCISALAFDWDGDGDHDLLLGSYENGHLYRQMNEGSDASPAYSGKNIPVLAGGKPWALPARMTAPRLVDWDGDGDMDLIAGTFGGHYGDGSSGGVYLSRNLGKPGAPEFGPLETLIAPGRMGATAPTRPDEGLYVDAADVDGDGDLDLVVGGYSTWTPPPRELTAEEKVEAAALRAQLSEINHRRMQVSQRYSKAYEAAMKDQDPTSKETRAKVAEATASVREELLAVGKEYTEVKKKLDAIVPSAQRQSFVWLYERLSTE
ncbi:MAG: VCBS repeat-containing protein [Planctomycetota bacterium]